MYHTTFWGLNWDFLLLEIVDILVDLSLALANYLHTKFVFFMVIPPKY